MRHAQRGQALVETCVILLGIVVGLGLVHKLMPDALADLQRRALGAAYALNLPWP